MVKKMFIVPFFGEYPSYLKHWIANMKYLKPMGYDYLIFSDLELFEKKVADKLDIDPFIIPGTGKPWDFRPTFGVIFEDELKGYDYWGHTDFDCLYGDVNKFMPDEELIKYDIWSNHHSYVDGPWSLYRNCDKINNLFKDCSIWKDILESNVVIGWEENQSKNGFSELVNMKAAKGEITKKNTFYQGHDPDIDTNLTFVNGKLYDKGEEIMTFHYNRKKRFPLDETQL